ncbi:hypothetical protein KIPB_012394 [Kipferlia bialata]|uniref:Uncharacterized protein n=1 Tax=Kipferlia bialata TaxID=797122 RepID=A0A9K3D9N1_9EUKA|nr:hypothetical protein KIPB_012394 [Kipferlia bialata]|eukprot:g12394.t1
MSKALTVRESQATIIGTLSSVGSQTLPMREARNAVRTHSVGVKKKSGESEVPEGEREAEGEGSDLLPMLEKIAYVMHHVPAYTQHATAATKQMHQLQARLVSLQGRVAEVKRRQEEEEQKARNSVATVTVTQ